jgi:hypothetical protein
MVDVSEKLSRPDFAPLTRLSPLFPKPARAHSSFRARKPKGQFQVWCGIVSSGARHGIRFAASHPLLLPIEQLFLKSAMALWPGRMRSLSERCS